MRRLRRQKDDQEDFGRWLLTYADMITLLLALFIVMYSMSRVDAKRFGKMAEALNGILKGGQSILKTYDDEQLKTGHGVLKLGDLRMIQRQVEEQASHVAGEGPVGGLGGEAERRFHVRCNLHRHHQVAHHFRDVAH